MPTLQSKNPFLELYLDRRTEPRKLANLPVKLIVHGKILSSGRTVNISCHGIKVEIFFVATQKKLMVNELLAIKSAVLEIGEVKDGFFMKIPAEIRWNTYSCDKNKEIYMAGMRLKFNGTKEEKEQWKHFCNEING